MPLPPPSMLKRKILIKNKRLKPEVEKHELELFRQGQFVIEDEVKEDASAPLVVAAVVEQQSVKVTLGISSSMDSLTSVFDIRAHGTTHCTKKRALLGRRLDSRVGSVGDEWYPAPISRYCESGRQFGAGSGAAVYRKHHERASLALVHGQLCSAHQVPGLRCC